MRIAQVSHQYLPHIGGIELYVRRLVSGLESREIEVEVLTTDYRTPDNQRKREARYFKTSFAFMGNPFSLDFLRHVRCSEYDVLHVHNVWFLPCLLAVRHRKNARVVTTLHGVYPDSAGAGLKILLALFKPFASYILRKSEKVIALSEREKGKLQKIFSVPPEKITVIPNGIDIEPCRDAPANKDILFTGRITAGKNPDLLLKALPLLDPRLQDYRVVFAGPVSQLYRERLNRLAEHLAIGNDIVYLPELDPSIESQRKELLGLYGQAAVFVSLGSWEGLPTRLMEAMQFEVPVIAYAAGGTGDLVDDGQNGLVLDRLDEIQLARMLDRLLLDENLAGRLGESARKTVEDRFDWTRIFPRILEVYRNPES